VLDGWTLSGIATLQSGAPVSVSLDNVTIIDERGGHGFSSTAWSGSPTQGARVQVINNTGDIHTMVLAPPPQGTLANAGRFLFRGPWLNNWDAGLFKRIPLPNRRWGLDLRMESYNLLNRTNFTSMETRARFAVDTLNGNRLTQTNPSFGNFTAAYPKRRLQLALRLAF